MLADAPDLNPVDERRSGDPFAAVFCPALRTALRDVSAEWAPKWARGSENESSINPVLTRLAERLEAVSNDSQAVPYPPRLLKRRSGGAGREWGEFGFATATNRRWADS